jgi:hypothetical protein
MCRSVERSFTHEMTTDELPGSIWPRIVDPTNYLGTVWFFIAFASLYQAVPPLVQLFGPPHHTAQQTPSRSIAPCTQHTESFVRTGGQYVRRHYAEFSQKHRVLWDSNVVSFVHAILVTTVCMTTPLVHANFLFVRFDWGTTAGGDGCVDVG